jgi:hypothetical protein
MMDAMPTNVALGCRCGRVRGLALGVSPDSTGHVVCYCDDCQAFARFLELPGIMDARGGTDIFQVPPARVRITEGLDGLECMRLSEKGLLRWYARCCRTPIGNTVSARVPFIGIIHAFRSREGDAPPRNDMLAKPVGIFGRSAIGGTPPDVHPRAPTALTRDTRSRSSDGGSAGRAGRPRSSTRALVRPGLSPRS